MAIQEIIKNNKGINRKFYTIHCNKCGWEGDMFEHSIEEQSKCSCCSKSVVAKGINDIATTDPWAVKYFLNPNDTKIYHNSSQTKTDMICPICGQIYKNIKIASFFKNVHHLNCPCKTTYSSYPERVIFNLLKQLGIDLKGLCNQFLPDSFICLLIN